LETPDDLWSYLAAHPYGPSVWLVTWKAAHRDKYVSRDEVLDALIAHGWIDLILERPGDAALTLTELHIHHAPRLEP